MREPRPLPRRCGLVSVIAPARVSHEDSAVFADSLGALGIAVQSTAHMASKSGYKPVLNGKKERNPLHGNKPEARTPWPGTCRNTVARSLPEGCQSCSCSHPRGERGAGSPCRFPPLGSGVNRSPGTLAPPFRQAGNSDRRERSDPAAGSWGAICNSRCRQQGMRVQEQGTPGQKNLSVCHQSVHGAGFCV